MNLIADKFMSVVMVCVSLDSSTVAGVQVESNK
jgi:hypothetical protein